MASTLPTAAAAPTQTAGPSSGEPATGTGTYTSVSTNTDGVVSNQTGTTTDVSTASCIISASNYDQSCTVGIDCALVTTGNFCVAGCPCGLSAISGAAFAQYTEAIANTPLGSGAVKLGACSCPPVTGPCCRQGTCTLNCQSASDTLPACANAGGTCFYGVYCSAYGPANSCAYADESCCLP